MTPEPHCAQFVIRGAPHKVHNRATRLIKLFQDSLICQTWFRVVTVDCNQNFAAQSSQYAKQSSRFTCKPVTPDSYRHPRPDACTVLASNWILAHIGATIVS